MTPETRREFFLDALAKEGGKLPVPVTREEIFLTEISQRIVNLSTNFEECVKKSDYATKENIGIMRLGGGLAVNKTGIVEVSSATNAEISAGINNYKPIVPANLASAMSAYGIASRDYIASLEARIVALENGKVSQSFGN